MTSFWNEEPWRLDDASPTAAEGAQSAAGLTARLERVYNVLAAQLPLTCGSDRFVVAMGYTGLCSLNMAASAITSRLREGDSNSSDDDELTGNAGGHRPDDPSTAARWPRGLRSAEAVTNVETWIGNMTPMQLEALSATLRLSERVNISCAVFAAGIKVYLDSVGPEKLDVHRLFRELLFSGPTHLPSNRSRAPAAAEAWRGRVTCAAVVLSLYPSLIDSVVAFVFPSPELLSLVNRARRAILAVINTKRDLLTLAAQLAPFVARHVSDSIVMEPRARFYPTAVALHDRIDYHMRQLMAPFRKRARGGGSDDEDAQID